MLDRLEEVGSSRGSGTAVARSSVILDPHHGAILDALNRTLDPDVFEACAAALLCHDYPTLVPVRGGADDGFDGAVADASGEPFPLITTTGEKLVANLRGNLDRTAKRGWSVARVLFATPRRVTPTTRKNLFEAARVRGVTLVQTYDQDWFAQSLYRAPEWCKRLLGVTGRPSALSLFPLTQRPVLGVGVLGREPEIRWLLEQEGDCLLTGEPGSGKTFLLLRTLALQGYARFLVDGDRTQIANDLRSLRPPVVIVDDAHVNPEQITELIQIRSEVRAEFRIIATSWPGFSDPVRSALLIGRAGVLDLGRLDANTVVEVIKSSGLKGPDRLLYVIRKQAAGRPGLAATLAHLCITGNVEDVVNGESLLQELHRGFRRMMGDDVLYHLAPFALGGDAGVKHDAVSRSLGVSPLDLRHVLAKIGAAGVVSQREDRAIAIEPEPLRWNIIKRVFFDDPLAPDIDPFLSVVENRRDALKTLIGVRYRGAAIPELEGWLEIENSSDLWSAYASLGAPEARSVLRRYPGIILDIAQSALTSAPETAIPMLLDRVSDNDVAQHDRTLDRLSQMSPDSAVEELETWAKAISRGGEHVLERRLAIVRATMSWWKRGGSGHSAIRAFCIALLPGLDYSTLDPGVGDTITHRSRMLHNDELSGLVAHWPEVLEVIHGTKHVPWNDLFDLVEAWFVPQARIFPPVRYGQTTKEILRDSAVTMLEGLSDCSRQHPGVQHRIGLMARRSSISPDLSLNPLFEVLCPSESISRTDWKSQRRQWSDSTSELANEWKSRSVNDIASLLTWFEHEANLAGIKGPRLSSLFCMHLAERMPVPTEVANALIRHELPSALLVPFLRRSAVEEHRGWSTLAYRCLGCERYRWTAVETVLKHRAPPRQLLFEAMSKAADMPGLKDFLASSCRSIPEATIKEMIESKDARVAVTGAVGYWLSYKGKVPDALRVPWRKAVLRSSSEGWIRGPDQHWLGEILSTDCVLGCDWLVSNLTDVGSTAHWATWELAKSVAGALSLVQREIVLDQLDAAGTTHVISEVMKTLVGGASGLYSKLLDSEPLKAHHLDPLEGEPDTNWRKMSLIALERGYSTQEIMHATVGRSWSCFGSESEMWIGRRQPFEALRNDPDSGITEIGRLGVEYTTYRVEAALARERKKAVEGHH